MTNRPQILSAVDDYVHIAEQEQIVSNSFSKRSVIIVMMRNDNKWPCISQKKHMQHETINEAIEAYSSQISIVSCAPLMIGHNLDSCFSIVLCVITPDQKGMSQNVWMKEWNQCTLRTCHDCYWATWCKVVFLQLWFPRWNCKRDTHEWKVLSHVLHAMLHCVKICEKGMLWSHNQFPNTY